MKRLIVASFLMSAALAARADGIPAVSTATPVAVRALADGFHVLDNGSVLTLRDVQNGVWALGSSTALAKKWYVSADGLLGYVTNTPNANGFYAVGSRVWLGELAYERLPWVRTLADRTATTARLLQYGTVGWWAARDFQYGIWRYGWQAGVALQF